MNIKEAKQEIKNAVAAYLEKDDYGRYVIPTLRQRPLLLMGAPGIGKTAIMEQVARECKIGLISYTITHHTRQSAIGLPFIKVKNFGGKEYSVTEYTMSEIIASVYEKIEETGIQEGILFIDEINCVSETLAPAMLQFLQCKTFGNHKVPEGYIIVAAGNPPEYNKSVREFDVVTLDRLKRIEVIAAFAPWKEYAYGQAVHGAILSYLEIKKENFYICETTIDGKIFVTARGWEDLSEMLYAYERLSISVDEGLIVQYLQHRRVAKDFANYLDLYNKYKADYRIMDILEGRVSTTCIARLHKAPFDERLSVIGLLLSRLSEAFAEAIGIDIYVSKLHHALLELKVSLLNDSIAGMEIDKYLDIKRQEFLLRKAAGHLTQHEERGTLQMLDTLESYQQELSKRSIFTGKEAFSAMGECFAEEVEKRKRSFEEGGAYLKRSFDFLEQVFGDSQEMVIFITELTMNPFSVEFIKENGSEQYYHYNQELLFSDKQKHILNDIQGAKDILGLL